MSFLWEIHKSCNENFKLAPRRQCVHQCTEIAEDKRGICFSLILIEIIPWSFTKLWAGRWAVFSRLKHCQVPGASRNIARSATLWALASLLVASARVPPPLQLIFECAHSGTNWFTGTNLTLILHLSASDCLHITNIFLANCRWTIKVKQEETDRQGSASGKIDHCPNLGPASILLVSDQIQDNITIACFRAVRCIIITY